MGLASLLLASDGHNVTAMDIHPKVEKILSLNARLNKLQPIPYVNASWANELTELGTFDLMIGSDLLYEPRHVKTLPSFLKFHARERSEIIIVSPDRGQLQEFQQSM